jgi:hypothetical protein
MAICGKVVDRLERSHEVIHLSLSERNLIKVLKKMVAWFGYHRKVQGEPKI